MPEKAVTNVHKDNGCYYPRKDVHDVMIAAVNSGNTQENDEHTVNMTDCFEVYPAEIQRAKRNGNVTAGKRSSLGLKMCVDKIHYVKEGARFY